jgi:hypothetical protein
VEGVTMAQIQARPRHLFSWDFDLFLDGEFLAGFDMSWLREGGHFTYGDNEYHLSREGFWSGDFLLTSDQEALARAAKSAFVRRFIVQTGSREFILEPASLFTRSFRLVEKGVVVGYVLPNHLFTRACTLELPDDLPVPVQVFLFWLVVLMWRRAASAGGSS